MLTSRGQENLVHARPAAGKALLPKTPSNFQTPRTTNRAPLGAKTTNAKAQTILKDKNNGKIQVFKTPAPVQQNTKPERSVKRPSATKSSGRTKITAAPTQPAQSDIVANEIDDDEPDYGYAPPPPVELPDPPMEFDYDQTFPQFRPENMFKGYGEVYLSSPKDENGLSIRLRKEEEEYRQYMDQQELEFTRKVKLELSKPYELSDDELDLPRRQIAESRPDTIKARSAASALSGMRLPSVANKQTASSRLKVNKPITTKSASKSSQQEMSVTARPLSVSKNTIGFPKAKRPPSIISQHFETSHRYSNDADILADELSDFDFLPIDVGEGEDVFQLPIPE